MGEILEAIMMISFGISWPISIMKSYKSKTAKGKSMTFTLLILFGYICGILSKFVSQNITYVLAVYIFNVCAVSVDLFMQIRNTKLDKERELLEAEA